MTAPATEPTEQQLKDFAAYVKVQKRGRWSMFDLQARLHTGLDKEEYSFVMRNYE